MAKGLGKGLSALLGDDITATGSAPKVQEIDIDKIKPGHYQPRTKFNEKALEELAQSVAEKGILQPLLLRQTEEGDYEIIAGERRWRASRIAGLKTVPALVKAFTPQESLEIGLVENLQREDLNDIEEAEGFQRLMDEFSYSQNKVAEIVGKSRSYVANNLRLNQLPEAVKDMLQQNKLTGGHARQLVGLDDAETIAKEIIEQGLNVRQVEALIRAKKNPKKMRSQQKKDAEAVAMEKELTGKLGLKVEVKKKRGNRGVISLSYDNIDQLDFILSQLSK